MESMDFFIKEFDSFYKEEGVHQHLMTSYECPSISSNLISIFLPIQTEPEVKTRWWSMENNLRK